MTVKTRATPARARPSTMTSPTVVRLIGLAVEALEYRSHPLERRAEIRFRIRVGKSQVTFAVFTERRPGERRHPGLLQQALGDLARSALRRRDVGEHVKGPARPCAADPGQAVEA